MPGPEIGYSGMEAWELLHLFLRIRDQATGFEDPTTSIARALRAQSICLQGTVLARMMQQTSPFQLGTEVLVASKASIPGRHDTDPLIRSERSRRRVKQLWFLSPQPNGTPRWYLEFCNTERDPKLNSRESLPPLYEAKFFRDATGA